MSLITRCPACATMFKVVPDQLRISEGWVRCGHCTEVFDACAHLQQDSGLAAAPASAVQAVEVEGTSEAAQRLDAAAMPAPEQPRDAAEPAFDAAVTAAPAVTEAERHEPELHEPELHELLEAAPLADPSEPATMEAGLPAAEPAVLAPAASAPWVMPEMAFARAAPADDPAFESSELPELAPQQVSFVREAQRKAFWRRPLIRALLVLLCLALLGGLALQVVVHERDRLAALEPRLKPLLQQLCVPLDCAVAPRRQIEAIVIDSSSFNRTRGDAYRLNLTIKNTASTELAMPGIELALTDGQDQAVLRRVLLPADLGAAAVLAAGAEWNGSLPISVAGNGAAARIAGYRVLAFYP